MHLHTGSQCCLLFSHAGSNKSAVLRHMQRSHLGQPNMPVNTCSLVKPALFHTGIHPHGNHIIAAKIKVLAHIKSKTGVATGLLPAIKAIHPDPGVPVTPSNSRKMRLPASVSDKEKLFRY